MSRRTLEEWGWFVFDCLVIVAAALLLCDGWPF